MGTPDWWQDALCCLPGAWRCCVRSASVTMSADKPSDRWTFMSRGDYGG